MMKKGEGEIMYNIKITDQGKEESSANRTSSSTPSGAPRTDKDFKKILGQKDNKNGERDSRNAKSTSALDGNTNYEEIVNAEESVKEQQPSLFDLSKGMMKKNIDEETSEVAKMASSDELPMESPSSMFKNLALKEKAKAKGSTESELKRVGDKKGDDLEAEENKVPTPFPRESMDLSYVNPLALNNPSVVEIGDQKLEKMLPSQKMTVQQLVDAIVKAVTTVEVQGKTDTIVTLKQPPDFANANLILTSYESAKGEFNIRFENLTPKALMDLQLNQESLLSTLQQKGYTVHMVITTTQIETPQIATAQSQQTSRDSEQQQEKQEQQRRRQKEEEEA